MKSFWKRLELLYVAVILLATFALILAMEVRWNTRWDLTPGKMYSLADVTKKTLQAMDGPLHIRAFYPHGDSARKNFEVFLKQSQLALPSLRFEFLDPDRAPTLTQKYRVKDIYTVILEYKNRTERIVQPTEQSFTSALARLLSPQTSVLCMVTGHGEAPLSGKDRNSYEMFRNFLGDNNVKMQEIILSRDKVPDACTSVVVAGPHNDFTSDEFQILKDTFNAGKGILFLIDPMEAGEGKAFAAFFKSFGVDLGMNVIVDKASRMVGGDFLVALVSQYMTQHPITKDFLQPTLFPVTRSVQPAVDLPAGLEVIPLALSSTESWAETNLAQLEKGEANFESSYDIIGPIPMAVAVETKKINSENPKTTAHPQKDGRLVVIGDSDFVSNAYFDLSGNANFALSVLRWLAKEDLLITLRPREEEFRPMLLSHRQRLFLLAFSLGVIPGLMLLAGLVTFFWRRRCA